MTRARIGGSLDYSRLAQLHRPTDADALRREARALAALGLSPLDIGQALTLAPAAVVDLLREDAA